MPNLTGMTKKLKLIPLSLSFVILAGGMLTAVPTLAVEGSTNGSAASATQPFTTYSLQNPLKAETPAELIGRFVKIFTGVVGSFCLLMFIYGGLTLLTSRGNPEQVQKGKQIFTWAIIGMIVIFTAYMVLTNIFKVIGAND